MRVGIVLLPAWQRSRVPRADVRSNVGSSARWNAAWPAAIAWITHKDTKKTLLKTKTMKRKKKTKPKKIVSIIQFASRAVGNEKQNKHTTNFLFFFCFPTRPLFFYCFCLVLFVLS